MPLNIKNIRVPSNSEWDKVWSDCPYSTYFHSREWAEIWMHYTHGRCKPQPLALELSDGLRVVLPLTKENIFRGLFTRYASSPAGTYGGWIAAQPLNDEQRAVVSEFMASRFSNLFVRANPYEPPLFPGREFQVTPDETQVLDLSVGIEGIASDMARSNIRAAKKAKRHGVEICLANSESDWLSYYACYEDSVRRWGESATTVYSWRLFQILFEARSQNIRLWLAHYGESVVAGALCFYSPIHAVYWHGAALSSHFDFRPVNLLIHEIIQDAVNRGFRWFDFNPSGGLTGVKAFKQSFGAQPKACDSYTRLSPIVRAARNFRQILLRDV